MRYYPDYLAHEGVKERSGRYRWGSGKRPFQRLGGTAKGYFEPNLKGGKGNDNKSAAEKNFSNTKNIVNDTRNIVQNFPMTRKEKEYSSRVHQQAKRMTDKELRDTINRKNLERQYENVMMDGHVGTGRKRAERILAVAGSIAAVGASGATMYSAIQNSKAKRKG